MRPKDRRNDVTADRSDLLRSRLDAIIDMEHPLVKLSRTIDWSSSRSFRGRRRRQAGPAAAVDTADGGPGDPPLGAYRRPAGTLKFKKRMSHPDYNRRRRSNDGQKPKSNMSNYYR